MLSVAPTGVSTSYSFFQTHVLVVRLRAYEEQMPPPLLTQIINVNRRCKGDELIVVPLIQFVQNVYKLQRISEESHTSLIVTLLLSLFLSFPLIEPNYRVGCMCVCFILLFSKRP